MRQSEITIRDDRGQSIKIVRDAVYDEMWRVQFPDGLSEMVNLTRAKDAAYRHMETQLGGRAYQKHRVAQAHSKPPVRKKTTKVSRAA